MRTIQAALGILLMLANIGSATNTDSSTPALVSEKIRISSTSERLPPSSVFRQPTADVQQSHIQKNCSDKTGNVVACGKGIAQGRQKTCGPRHKKHKCSSDDCCSVNGQCGRSEAFCGKHCLPDYGECWRNKTSREVQNPHRCGKDFNGTRCGDGECCSAAGWCGKGTSYCFVPYNCQIGFGICDSDAVPKGPDLAPSVQPRPQVGNVPYGKEIKKCKRPRTIALTFDDGPSNNTMRILDVLRDHGAKATFFLSGNNNGKGMIDENNIWITAIKRIINEGHQVGSHTWSHPHLETMSRDARIYEMIRNDRAIANIIGKFPTYMRPPYLGCSQESGCLPDMTELGYHVLQWDVDSRDWEPNQGLEQIWRTIGTAIDHRRDEENMILIQHDHAQHVVEATKRVLDKIKNKKWQAVTVGDCLEDPPELWYTDPVWIEPKSMSAHDGVSEGCLVSEPGFCGRLLGFGDLDQCGIVSERCFSMIETCEEMLGRKHPSCGKYSAICKQQTMFCADCVIRGQKQCDSRAWSFNRFT